MNSLTPISSGPAKSRSYSAPQSAVAPAIHSSHCGASLSYVSAAGPSRQTPSRFDGAQPYVSRPRPGWPPIRNALWIRWAKACLSRQKPTRFSMSLNCLDNRRYTGKRQYKATSPYMITSNNHIIRLRVCSDTPAHAGGEDCHAPRSDVSLRQAKKLSTNSVDKSVDKRDKFCAWSMKVD